MNTVVLNIKTKPEVKQKAQVIASKLGLSLSSVLNAYLRHFVRTKAINFSLNEETPTSFLLENLKQSEKELRNGNVYKFTNPKKAMQFLTKKKSC